MRVRPLLSITLGAMALGAGSLHAQTHQVEIFVTEAGVGAPIEGALAQVTDGGPSAVTDAEGRAILRGLSGEEVEIEISRIGYETVEVTLTLPRSLPLRVALGVRAVELDGVEAEGRMRRSEIDVTQPFHRDVIYGEEMARAEVRGGTVEDLLRTRPGVRIVCPSIGSCHIRLVRGHMSIAPEMGGSPGPLWILDGVRVARESADVPLMGI
jgi:hypothetical protein